MEYKVYDLSTINNHNTLDIFDRINQSGKSDKIDKGEDNLPLIHKHWMKNDKVYNILKYNRATLTYDMINTIGLWRSVIYSNKKINVFSPPKSLNINIFVNQYPACECMAEEFIEGTMINLFYDEDIDKWEIASKSSVGGNVTFYQDQPTFAELFHDICKELEIDINKFSKEYSYSFIIQHEKNRFVIPISEKRLYLIAMYKIDNENLKVIEYLGLTRRNKVSPIGTLDQDILKKLSFAMSHSFSSYQELGAYYASMNTNIYTMGIVIHHKDGMRSKMRNPNYEYLKNLRGNNTKLQYQYLCLRKLNNVKEYLRFFPDNGGQFITFKNQVHLFTDTLYQNYISCYMRKDKPLKEFSSQFRTHMYNLHQIYLSIREEKGYINKYMVINYVNELEPAKLMYSLNYHLREIGKKTNVCEESTKDVSI